MTERVKICSASVGITIFVMVLLVGLMLMCFYVGEPIGGYVMAVALIGMSVAALFFIPLSVTADKKGVTLNFAVRSRTFPLSEIADVRRWIVESDTIRIWASGGWFGYWGWFRSRGLGKFFGYYGDRSQCFLMRLRDGRYYVIGCVNPGEMVDYIKKELPTP